MPEHFTSIGEAIGSAMAHNARAADDLAAARRLAEQPAATGPTPGPPPHCKTLGWFPASQEWIEDRRHLIANPGPAEAQQDTVLTVPDTGGTPGTSRDNASRAPETPQANEPGQQDTTPDTDTPDVTSHLYRDALLVLLSRLVRGVLLPDERTLLREHVEHLLAAVDRSDDAARRALEQRQEMAEERYAWQERGRKAERAADLLAGSHRRAEEAEAALARVEGYAHELAYQDAKGLLAALDGPAGQVDDSSPTPAPLAHPDAEQQANGTAAVGEMPVTVEALAQMLSAADVEINHGDYPTWETLAESGTEQYRQAARYVLKRCRITTKSAPAVGPCERHTGAPVIGGMCGGCTAYPADMRR